MKFDLFGKQVLEVVSRDNNWQAFYCGNNGVKRLATDVTIPAEVTETTVEQYLSDLLHEWASIEHPSIVRLS